MDQIIAVKKQTKKQTDKKLVDRLKFITDMH